MIGCAHQIADVMANTAIESLLAIYGLFGHSITRPIKLIATDFVRQLTDGDHIVAICVGHNEEHPILDWCAENGQDRMSTSFDFRAKSNHNPTMVNNSKIIGNFQSAQDHQ
jgi:hypothetical protein